MYLAPIKLFVMDVDGTLTDGKVYLDLYGEEIYAYSKIDGEGIRKLLEAGIEVIVISSEEINRTLDLRLQKLGIYEWYLAIKDKATFLKDLMQTKGLEPSEVAYIGDDISDLQVIKEEIVSLFFCPKDAYLLNYISEEDREEFEVSCKGGDGAVRCAADHVLNLNQLMEENFE
jgi:3-deoxy-D-manno-octulosonate 8-phosphate phosphatase (KDO 8-P phosphatase)